MSAEPMTMLEKAADAVRSFPFDVDARGCLVLGPVTCERIARAVLLAVREPSEGAQRAMAAEALSISLCGDYGWLDYMTDLHRVAIDHILTESTGGRDGDR